MQRGKFQENKKAFFRDLRSEKASKNQSICQNM